MAAIPTRPASQFHVLNFFSPDVHGAWGIPSTFIAIAVCTPNIITSNPHFHLVLIASNPYVEYRTPHDIFSGGLY